MESQITRFQWKQMVLMVELPKHCDLPKTEQFSPWIQIFSEILVSLHGFVLVLLLPLQAVVLSSLVLQKGVVHLTKSQMLVKPRCARLQVQRHGLV